MTKLIIKAEYAELIAPFRSTEETRYYLRGFNTKQAPQGGVLICATDGHTLGLFHDAAGVVECADKQCGDTWLLTSDSIKACKSNKRDGLARWLVILEKDLFVVLADSAENAEGAARNANDPEIVLHRAVISPIDGVFPDYNRVIPSSDVFGPCQGTPTYNAEYLAKFGKVGKSGNGYGAAITIHAQNEIEPAIVQTGREDFIGVIMPVQSLPSWNNLPNWYGSSPTETTQAAE